MTEETVKIFDAPWKDATYSVEDMSYFDIKDAHGQVFCSCWVQYYTSKEKPGIDEDAAEKTMNRILRLPELYDALANAVRDACQDCVDQVYDHPTGYDPVEYGCLFKDKNCCEMCRSWIELLRKVRNGEGVSETDQN